MIVRSLTVQPQHFFEQSDRALVLSREQGQTAFVVARIGDQEVALDEEAMRSMTTWLIDETRLLKDETHQRERREGR